MAMDMPFSVLWKVLPSVRASNPIPNFDQPVSPPIHLCYLVTGTGRSGTVSLACALSSAGIPCSHERFFRGDSVEAAFGLLLDGKDAKNSSCSEHCGLPELGARVVAESSYLAAPHLAAPFLAGATVIHAVRSPWQVIPSFLNNIQFFRGEPIHEHERFIYAALPELHHLKEPVDRAAYYYIHWNLMIEWLGARHLPAQYIFHRIEDGPAALLRQLGEPTIALHNVPTRDDINNFEAWQPHLKPPRAKRIPTQDIRRSAYWKELCQIALRYGYDILPDWPEEQADAVGDQEEAVAPPPRLVESDYRNFNVVLWRNLYYGIDRAVGHLDLETAAYSRLKELAEQGMCLIGNSLKETKEKVDRQMTVLSLRARGSLASAKR
jgi:hypothetical protein